MLDVIHLIVTVMSFECECNVTGRPIWFRLLKWTVSTCFRVVVAQHGMARCCLGVWQKDGGRCSRWWLSRYDVTFLRKSRALVKRHRYFNYCVHFTVDWLIINLYSSYIFPRPLLSWKKPGHFSFDNMGPLIKCIIFFVLIIYIRVLYILIFTLFYAKTTCDELHHVVIIYYKSKNIFFVIWYSNTI